MENKTIDYENLWKDTCIFCSDRIQTRKDEKMKTHNIGGYCGDEYENRLHITHHPAENIIAFEIRLDEGSRRMMDGYITSRTSELMDAFENIKHQAHPSGLFQKIHAEMSLPEMELGGRNISLSIFRDEISSKIENIMKDYAHNYEKNAKEAVNELLFDTSYDAGGFKSKKYNNCASSSHSDELYLPDSIKSHLGCWPFKGCDGEVMRYKDFYSKIEGRIAFKHSSEYPEILEQLMDKRIYTVLEIKR